LQVQLQLAMFLLFYGGANGLGSNPLTTARANKLARGCFVITLQPL